MNGNNSSNVLNITGLTAGTNYTFHVYTVYENVLSEKYTTIQSFTSKKICLVVNKYMRNVLFTHVKLH